MVAGEVSSGLVFLRDQVALCVLLWLKTGTTRSYYRAEIFLMGHERFNPGHTRRD